MARLPRTSAASYALFKQRAWNTLSQPVNAALDTGQKSTVLYQQCYKPALDAVPAKVPLRDRELIVAMQTLLFNAGLTNAGNARVVRIQGGNVLTNNERLEFAAWADYLNHWAITRCLCCCLLNEPEDLSADAVASQRAYLHIYAAGGRVENNNWRVGFNILPADIPEAVRLVCPILDANADIGHFKVSAPGTASKPDSLIVYMQNTNATYANIRQALENALGGLRFQETFAPMWNEFALGMAEAAEPPKVSWPLMGGGHRSLSFGRFRCLATAVAFETALANDAGGVLGNLTQPQFDNRVDQAFPIYGMPLATPHDQGQLALAYNNADNLAYMRAFALYKGKAGNYYTNRQAVFQNRPVYP